LLTIVIVKSRRLSRRLVRLIDTAEEYENGFFEVTLNPAKKDRMGLLTAAFIELGKALERLSRYTNKQVIELAREDRTPLEAESPEAALLVIRINNFRQLTRPMTGEETSELLNLFLARINPCISKTGGVINTFWTTDGFSLLAVWGKAAAVPNPRRNAEAALRSCVLIHAAVKTVNRDLAVIHARRNAGNDIGGGGIP
jgi:adenylate cyclase